MSSQRSGRLARLGSERYGACVQHTMLIKLCSIERVRVYSSTTHLCWQYSLIRFCTRGRPPESE